MNLSEVLGYIQVLLSSENLVIRAADANTHVHANALISNLINQEAARLNAAESVPETLEVKADEG